MERAIETLIKNFHQYSVEGGKETLTPSELQDLVTQQLPHLMPVLPGLRPRHPDLPLPWEGPHDPTHTATGPQALPPLAPPLACTR